MNNLCVLTHNHIPFFEKLDNIQDKNYCFFCFFLNDCIHLCAGRNVDYILLM